MTFDEVNIYIENPEFAQIFKNMLDSIPKRVQANYMFYNALLSKREYVVHDFYTTLKDVTFLSKREFCFNRLGRIFNRAVPVLYYNFFVTSHNSETVHNITKNIKNQYVEELIKLSYSDETVFNVTQYYETLEILYGYFESLKDESHLEPYYSDLNLNKSSFYENFLEAHKILKKDTDTFYDLLSLLRGNAFFDPTTLRIGLPATIMEVPLLSTNYPIAINYGGFGFLFAHELAHALLSNPLVDYPRTEDNFECIVKQYGNHTIFGSNMKVTPFT